MREIAEKRAYRWVSEYKRRQLIDEVVNGNQVIKQVALRLNIHYSNAKTIIQAHRTMLETPPEDRVIKRPRRVRTQSIFRIFETTKVPQVQRRKNAMKPLGGCQRKARRLDNPTAFTLHPQSTETAPGQQPESSLALDA